jgi:hypothetical protein
MHTSTSAIETLKKLMCGTNFGLCGKILLTTAGTITTSGKGEKIMKCDVCGKESETFVAASAYGPISFAYCRECLENGLEPYDAIVAYIACAGHFPEDINEAYQKDVCRQLKLCEVSEDQFIKDVEDCIKEMRNGY